MSVITENANIKPRYPLHLFEQSTASGLPFDVLQSGSVNPEDGSGIAILNACVIQSAAPLDEKSCRSASRSSIPSAMLTDDRHIVALRWCSDELASVLSLRPMELVPSGQIQCWGPAEIIPQILCSISWSQPPSAEESAGAPNGILNDCIRRVYQKTEGGQSIVLSTRPQNIEEVWSVYDAITEIAKAIAVEFSEYDCGVSEYRGRVFDNADEADKSFFDSGMSYIPQTLPFHPGQLTLCQPDSAIGIINASGELQGVISVSLGSNSEVHILDVSVLNSAGDWPEALVTMIESAFQPSTVGRSELAQAVREFQYAHAENQPDDPSKMKAVRPHDVPPQESDHRDRDQANLVDYSLPLGVPTRTLPELAHFVTSRWCDLIRIGVEQRMESQSGSSEYPALSIKVVGLSPTNLTHLSYNGKWERLGSGSEPFDRI